MQHEITLKVNGTEHSGTVEARTLLVDFLRENLGFTGTHVGCEHGICGACTIFMNGHSVRSCLLFAVQADGAEIMTIEGLCPNGQLTSLQRALWENHGLQCGFCTPGVLICATELLEKDPNPTEERIREALASVLCRCTGYHHIVASVKAAAAAMNGTGDEATRFTNPAVTAAVEEA